MQPLKTLDLWWCKEKLSNLKNDVTFVYFTEETQCRHCQQEKDILIELADSSNKLHLEVYNPSINHAAARYGADKVPGLILVGEKDYGIRFFGLPSDYELRTFGEDLLMVSERESGLSQVTKEKIKDLDKSIHLEVFSIPACMYSQGSIRLAHQLALESNYITGDMIDVMEFPEMVQKYDLHASPTVIVNGTYRFYGALMENHFVDEVLKGIN